MSTKRGTHRRGMSGRYDKWLARLLRGSMPLRSGGAIAIDAEQIKLQDGKPLRRLRSDGRYLGVDGKVYDE